MQVICLEEEIYSSLKKIYIFYRKKIELCWPCFSELLKHTCIHPFAHSETWGHFSISSLFLFPLSHIMSFMPEVGYERVKAYTVHGRVGIICDTQLVIYCLLTQPQITLVSLTVQDQLMTMKNPFSMLLQLPFVAQIQD